MLIEVIDLEASILINLLFFDISSYPLFTWSWKFLSSLSYLFLDFLFLSLAIIFEEDKLTTYHFGLIASFPKSFERIAKQEKVELDVIKTCADSKWIAEPGSKVESKITVVNYIFSRNYNSHIYTAKTPENNLVTFWSQKDTNELAPIGKTITIKGKVKRVGESRFYDGVKETMLNHVKKVPINC